MVNGTGDFYYVPPGKSRTRQHVEKQAQNRVSEARLTRLEAQLEDETRRNLQLSRQLDEEVALRARAERTRDELLYEREDLELKLLELTEKEGKKRERSRRATGVRKSRGSASAGGKVPDGLQQPDGSPSPIGEDLTESADSSGDGSEKRTAGSQRSSRVRGNVK